MSKTVIALCGKGGVGKTTVCAIIARALSRKHDKKVLVVDADHAGGLSMALGIEPEITINDVRKSMVEQLKSEKSDREAVALSLDYMLMDAINEAGNVAFLAIGRAQETGCYCPLNSVLRQAISQLSGGFDITLIDAEAGMEQVSREVMESVGHMLLVSDTSAKSLRVAADIRGMIAKSNSEVEARLLVNRVRNEDEAKEIFSKVDLEIAGWIPEDETVRIFDGRQQSFFELPDCPASSAVEKALAKLLAGD